MSLDEFAKWWGEEEPKDAGNNSKPAEKPATKPATTKTDDGKPDDEKPAGA